MIDAYRNSTGHARRAAWCFAVLLTAVICTSEAAAALVSPTTWARGTDPRSTYQDWDKFVSPPGPNPPNSPNLPAGAVVDAAPFNPNGTANAIDLSGASFITSGGNIYSPTAVIDLRVKLPNYAAGAAQWTTILVQTRTQGTGVDVGSLRIVVGGASHAPVDSSLLFVQPLGGFGGVLEDRWFQFQVPGNAGEYTLQFQAAGSSMSLDRVVVDTIWTAAQQPITEPNPVPEPATVVLAFFGLAALAAARLARRRAARWPNRDPRFARGGAEVREPQSWD